MDATFAVRVAGFLTAYHNALTLLPIPKTLHVPANITTAALIVRASRTRGLSNEAAGLSRAAVGRGLRWGAAVSAAIGAGVASIVVLRPRADLLHDERVGRIGAREVVYRLIVHIPLGTVVPEEVLFRGVLFGMWSRDKGQSYAALASSVAFGLWHIGPAIDRLRANHPNASSRARASAIAGTIAATTLAGACLSLLRIGTKGILGPIIVHWAANAFATLGTRFASNAPGESVAQA